MSIDKYTIKQRHDIYKLLLFEVEKGEWWICNALDEIGYPNVFDFPELLLFRQENRGGIYIIFDSEDKEEFDDKHRFIIREIIVELCIEITR